nr:hypothetical protein [Tanacetum cinerariifolium]
MMVRVHDEEEMEATNVFDESIRLHTLYLCEYVDLYYIKLEGTDVIPTGTWGDRYNCGPDMQDVGCQFCYKPMDGDTVVRKSSMRPNGFARYPFKLVEFDSLEPTNNKYLIDAVGYATNVGKTTITRSGLKTLYFHLVNNRRGQSVRVTMWGGLGEMLIEKQTCHVRLYPIVLTAMSVKLYNSKPYSVYHGIELAKELLSAVSTGAKARTLKNLLMLAATFHCTIRIDKIKTKRGWHYPSCGGKKCKKGNLNRKNGRFWCDSCHNSMDYPVLRLELEVLDDTACNAPLRKEDVMS